MARRPHEDLRAAALAEAEGLLRAEGLEALTARRVAAGVGISVGTLYNLFGHLDGLVRALNRRSMARLHNRLETALDAAPGTQAEDRLTALSTAYLDFAEAEPAAWDALFRHRLTTPPEAEAPDADAGSFDGLLALLRRAAGDGPPDEALIALWAAAHGVVELAASRRLPQTDPATTRRYLAMIIRAVSHPLMTHPPRHDQ